MLDTDLPTEQVSVLVILIIADYIYVSSYFSISLVHCKMYEWEYMK